MCAIVDMAPLIKIIWAQLITPLCLVEPDGITQHTITALIGALHVPGYRCINSISLIALYTGLYRAHDTDKLSTNAFI